MENKGRQDSRGNLWACNGNTSLVLSIMDNVCFIDMEIDKTSQEREGNCQIMNQVKVRAE